MSSAVKQAIVPALWSGQLGKVVSQGYDQQVRKGWRFIPDSLNDLFDWAEVVDDDHPGSAGTRLYHLVYAQDITPDAVGGRCTVTIVLQGFLGAHALGVLGNWRGKERDAQSASQFLVLESGGCDVAFKAQVEALLNVRRLIAMRLGGDVEGFDEAAKTITLRRHVFTRVKSTDDGTVPRVTLTDVTDPYGHARAMAKMWRVDHTVRVSIRRSNGTVVDVVPDVLKRGDFVEVTASARIEVMRSRKRRGVNVQFEMHEVVRLLTAPEVKVCVDYVALNNVLVK
ncbi:hypothetical protein FKP32DRAFT_1578977 [Trametes sanguinea]|nr:hypothetical protein FKP32DRAFT_1578977 [Trametes sanguinea]